MSIILRRTLAVFRKDLRSELRTRYTLNAILLFVLTTVMMIAFATRGEIVNDGVASGLLWVIMFFSAMTGLARAFVAEEERGTSLLLRLSSPPAAVFFGKLLYNVLMTLLLNFAGITLFFIFVGGVAVGSPGLFLLVIALASLATAASTTLISAIIARSRSRGALFPVLSFPIMLPLVLPGVELTLLALGGADMAQAQNNLQLMVSYLVVLTTVSWLLFDFVWKE